MTLDEAIAARKEAEEQFIKPLQEKWKTEDEKRRKDPGTGRKNAMIENCHKRVVTEEWPKKQLINFTSRTCVLFAINTRLATAVHLPSALYAAGKTTN